MTDVCDRSIPPTINTNICPITSTNKGQMFEDKLLKFRALPSRGRKIHNTRKYATDRNSTKLSERSTRPTTVSFRRPIHLCGLT